MMKQQKLGSFVLPALTILIILIITLRFQGCLLNSSGLARSCGPEIEGCYRAASPYFGSIHILQDGNCQLSGSGEGLHLGPFWFDGILGEDGRASIHLQNHINEEHDIEILRNEDGTLLFNDYIPLEPSECS